jgi:hypothetical protein
MTRVVTTRRHRFLPYRYDEHGLDMGFVRCQLEGMRDAPAFDTERRVLELSGERFNTAALRLAVTVEAALLEASFPPDERAHPPGRVVVLATCAATRVRRSIILSDGVLAAGRLEGTIELYARDLSGTMELVPMLLRSTERVGADDGYASAAWTRLASGRAIEVRIDAARPLHGEYLDIRYESFAEKGPPQFTYASALYQLDCNGDAPVLWLNTDHQRVAAVLEAAGTVGRAARLRDLLFQHMSVSIWTQLFWRSAHAVVETSETLYEWQDAVLARLLPKLYRDVPDPESRIEALREELDQDRADDVTARLDLVLQDDLEIATRAERLAEELE